MCGPISDLNVEEIVPPSHFTADTAVKPPLEEIGHSFSTLTNILVAPSTGTDTGC